MKYAYVRTSTKEQNEQRQIYAMNNIGVEKDNIYMDKMSGKDFNRPKYIELVNRLGKGDILYILSIDRLGRNYEDIMEQWHLITKEKGADIVVLDMPLLNTTVENHDLTGRFIADLVLQILSYVAQKERESIRQRQEYGIKKAKEEGRYIKKQIPTALFNECLSKVKSGQMTVVAACEVLGISRATWYIKVKKHQEEGLS